jgi:hypothetical protein
MRPEDVFRAADKRLRFVETVLEQMLAEERAESAANGRGQPSLGPLLAAPVGALDSAPFDLAAKKPDIKMIDAIQREFKLSDEERDELHDLLKRHRSTPIITVE